MLLPVSRQNKWWMDGRMDGEIGSCIYFVRREILTAGWTLQSDGVILFMNECRHVHELNDTWSMYKTCVWHWKHDCTLQAQPALSHNVAQLFVTPAYLSHHIKTVCGIFDRPAVWHSSTGSTFQENRLRRAWFLSFHSRVLSGTHFMQQYYVIIVIIFLLFFIFFTPGSIDPRG